MAAFVRLTSEPFPLVDHDMGDPEQRWNQLKELCEDICKDAKSKGLLQLTCFIPPELEQSFGKRLTDEKDGLGFVKSPWQSYTRNL